MKYDLDMFAHELKALLRKAKDAGLEVDDFCALAEDIISFGNWNDNPEDKS